MKLIVVFFSYPSTTPFLYLTEEVFKYIIYENVVQEKVETISQAIVLVILTAILEFVSFYLV